MRMSRFGWLAKMFRPLPPRPRRGRRGRAGKAGPRTFDFVFPDGSRHQASALTKSEARAVLKKTLGLPRLPAGTESRPAGVA